MAGISCIGDISYQGNLLVSKTQNGIQQFKLPANDQAALQVADVARILGVRDIEQVDAFMQRHDADKNGFSRRDFDRALFAMDRNQDGIVTAAERQAIFDNQSAPPDQRVPLADGMGCEDPLALPESEPDDWGDRPDDLSTSDTSKGSEGLPSEYLFYKGIYEV